ncbi:MAG: homoserine kinase [Thermoplasmata archaeon]|nr:homoserine kinase [Thermoplasmata archaeon]
MSSPKSIMVEAPATMANFGPGYDTFGLCIDRPVDILEIERLDGKGIELEVSKRGYKVPLDIDENTASVAARELLRLYGKDLRSISLRMWLRKGIRPGSGLGSSAASAVSGALGVASLLGLKDKKKILMAAAKGEAVSSGTPHLDNVSPCLFGGFTVVLDHRKLDILRIKPPQMKIVVCLPEMVIETAKARELIPKHVPVKTSISHSSWASGVVHGMKAGDISLVARCLRDEIAVPARKQLIEGFDSARKEALSAGALSFSISGSGPAVYSLAEINHESIGKAMVKGFREAGVKSKFFIAMPGKGARAKTQD